MIYLTAIGLTPGGSGKVPEIRQAKFVPLAGHMVWYSIIAAYPDPCCCGECSACVCMITCICLCRCGLCLCLRPCMLVHLSACLSVCVRRGYSPQPPEAAAPLPTEGRAGGQRLGLAGTPGKVAR
jgi:hypothetical protein